MGFRPDPRRAGWKPWMTAWRNGGVPHQTAKQPSSGRCCDFASSLPAPLHRRLLSRFRQTWLRCQSQPPKPPSFPRQGYGTPRSEEREWRRPDKIQPELRRDGAGGLATWLTVRGWIGSRLAADGKCRLESARGICTVRVGVNQRRSGHAVHSSCRRCGLGWLWFLRLGTNRPGGHVAAAGRERTSTQDAGGRARCARPGAGGARRRPAPCRFMASRCRCRLGPCIRPLGFGPGRLRFRIPRRLRTRIRMECRLHSRIPRPPRNSILSLGIFRPRRPPTFDQRASWVIQIDGGGTDLFPCLTRPGTAPVSTPRRRPCWLPAPR